MALFVSLLCVIAGIWLLLQFAPQVYLDILITDPAADDRFLTATITVQNSSRSRIGKQTILLQCLAYSDETALKLTDGVPFKTSSVRSGEEPIAWQEPREIFRDVHYLFPGETLTTEYLIPRPADADIIHVGLQFNSAQGPLENLVGRFITLNRCWESAAFKLVGTNGN